jgi:hypothetical protein
MTSRSLLHWQPESYNPGSSDLGSSKPSLTHTQSSIRLDTLQLSDMLLSPTARDTPASSQQHFPDVFESSTSDVGGSNPYGPDSPINSSVSFDQFSPIPGPSRAAQNNLQNGHSPVTGVRNNGFAARPLDGRSHQPSGLSLLRPNAVTDASSHSANWRSIKSPSDSADDQPLPSSPFTPPAETMAHPRMREELSASKLATTSKSALLWDHYDEAPPANLSSLDLRETTPLLTGSAAPPTYTTFSPSSLVKKTADRVKKELSTQSLEDYGRVAVKSIPAVILGCLLNILDAVSCMYIPLFHMYFCSF